MVEILGRGRFEGGDLAALRVDAGHDMLDGAILARGVHRLENQEHRPFVLRVELVLQFAEHFDCPWPALPWRAACPRP